MKNDLNTLKSKDVVSTETQKRKEEVKMENLKGLL